MAGTAGGGLPRGAAELGFGLGRASAALPTVGILPSLSLKVPLYKMEGTGETYTKQL